MHNLFSASQWLTYLTSALRGLIIALPVAILFEIAGVITRSVWQKRLVPALRRDQQRDAAARARRRRALHDDVSLFVRWIQTIAALVVIFTLWHVDAIAVAIVLAAIVFVARGSLADIMASWSLLLDDVVAVGDQVQINGQLAGTVSEMNLRRLCLTSGTTHTWVRASDIQSVRVIPAAAPTAAPEGPAKS